jgi:hypothetical protein
VVVKLALRYADVSFAGGLDYGLDGGHAPAGIALMAGKASGLLDAWASSRRLVYTAPQCVWCVSWRSARLPASHRTEVPMRPGQLVFLALSTPTTARQGPMTTPSAQVERLELECDRDEETEQVVRGYEPHKES